jgi:hypothetical protein
MRDLGFFFSLFFLAREIRLFPACTAHYPGLVSAHEQGVLAKDFLTRVKRAHWSVLSGALASGSFFTLFCCIILGPRTHTGFVLGGQVLQRPCLIQFLPLPVFLFVL